MDKNVFGTNLRFIRKSKKITGEELAKKLDVTPSSVSLWENGKTFPSTKTLMQLCKILEVYPTDLYSEHFMKTEMDLNDTQKIKITKIPVLGNIACGEPIFAEELVEFYVDAFNGIKADFAVWAKGDSMIDARINDGDLVFIRKQERVENGEIAAVLIGNEATLKRFYWDEKNLICTLMPANPKYQPLIFLDDELENLKILGKAVAFQSLVK